MSTLKIRRVPAGRVFRLLRRDTSSRSTSGRLAPTFAATDGSSTDKARRSESFHHSRRDLISGVLETLVNGTRFEWYIRICRLTIEVLRHPGKSVNHYRTNLFFPQGGAIAVSGLQQYLDPIESEVA